MRKLINYSYLLMLFSILVGCKEEFIVPTGGGSPTIEIVTKPNAAFFADSISYKVKVADQGVDLSTLKVELLYSEDVVASQTIRTKEYGEYQGKLFVPFLKNVANGTATLRFTVQNVELTKTEALADLPLTRPDFPFLNLIVEGKTYKMLRKAANQYEVSDNFATKVNGYIEAPAFGANGNTVQFGWDGEAITQGVTANIPFSNIIEGVYPISFNTMTYQASPFVAYKLNGEDMTMVAEDVYSIDMDMDKDQELVFEGLQGLDTWWVDSDFLRKDGDKFLFNAIKGRYRITADLKKKYFIVEAMNGSNLASLNADGTGAIWIIGEGIGKPSVASNEVGWNTDKALCFAPIGGKKYRVTVVAGTSIRANSINFKFFHQKGWGGEFKDADISTTSDNIFVGNGSNGRDPGNLGIVNGKQLEAGATYVLEVDLSQGNNKAVLTVNKQQ